MSSTYSDLKIELIGTGDQSGTWGTTTNVNLGTAIEEAITGSSDVAFSSSDVTLTLTDTNATQSARNLRLNLTGTSGGARNLIVPAIEKVYIINNGLADAVTVKNSTGTGIAVAAGKTMYVYNDGTNVVDAITHLSSLTLGSALPVASGGTGSTSTTYCSLTSNVSGTLPVANGGTGAATLTANNVILGNGTSTVLGVAPGTSGNVLTSNGTTWTSAAVESFDTGTRMLFAQTSAPTGWTKDTTNYDNHSLRVVTGTAGTGGTVDFTTAFTSQSVSVSGTTGDTSAGGTVANHTLTTAQMPSHKHTIAGFPNGKFLINSGNNGSPIPGYNSAKGNGAQKSTAQNGLNNTGSGGAHNHSFTGSSHNHSFSGSASIDLAVKYLDTITATKD